MDDGHRRLLSYMWLVVAIAVPVVAATAISAKRTGLSVLTGRSGVAVLLLSVILVAGEMWPIPVTRGEDSADAITVSSTFGLALMLVAPVYYVIVAQAIALIIDWAVRPRSWQRLPFNIAQYALAFTAARAVYTQVAGLSFDYSMNEGTPNLPGAVAAGIAFLIVNNGLVAVAVALRLRTRLWAVLSHNLTWQLMTSVPLLGLGPLAAQASQWTPWSVILLLIPVIALYLSGRTAMKREQEALRDPLTGLANRTMLSTAAERALQSSSGIAMLLIDLDHFKDVNDTLGHAVGDELLRSVASRITDEVATTDLVVRLGGDEFIVLVRTIINRDSVVALAHRLREAINAPYTVQDVSLAVGCSIGIGLAPEHADNVQDLLRCADVALYSAKAERGTVTVYDRRSDQHSAALLGLQADLRAALEDPDSEQLYVVYQPQLTLDNGRIVTVEALVRWAHPELGCLLPDNFIPMAESTSLIHPLMRRVLDTSLAQLAEWDSEGLHLSVAVNLSARQLSDLGLSATVAELLGEHGIHPSRLVLEVTESRLMSDPERSARILVQLQDAGVEISIDDFGTGYSSLTHLQRLGVNELKIDKSFILALHEPGNATIVRSTIELGHNLGLRVIAEGVESVDVLRQLTDMGCDLIQGYLVGRPSPSDQIPMMLVDGHARWRAAMASNDDDDRPVVELVTAPTVRTVAGEHR